MNWFTLWLMWLSKMSSFAEVGLHWQVSMLEQRKPSLPPESDVSAEEASRQAAAEPGPPPVPSLPEAVAASPVAVSTAPEVTKPEVSPPAAEPEPPPVPSLPEAVADPVAVSALPEVTEPEPPPVPSLPEAVAAPEAAVLTSPEAAEPESPPVPPLDAPPPLQEIARKLQEIASEPEEAAAVPLPSTPAEAIPEPLPEVEVQEAVQAVGEVPPPPEPPPGVEVQEAVQAAEEVPPPPEPPPEVEVQEAVHVADEVLPPPPTPPGVTAQEAVHAAEEVPARPAVRTQLQETIPAPQEQAPLSAAAAPSRLEKVSPPQDIAPHQQQAAFERLMSGTERTGEGSMSWRKRPMIYEIPTWVWLDEMRAKHGPGVTLGSIPAAEWDALAALDIDAVWLMGVWKRSPAGIAVSNANTEQQDEFRRLLPDYTLADNVGSAYCVRDYVVAEHLGGPGALAQARAALNARGLRLILDFVPNHVAIDHPWAALHPDYFIRGTNEDLARAPAEFVEVKGQVLANGRDPYFAPWRDVLQLNAYHTQLRAAVIETVTSIAAQCDGMRCDMAMLLLNDIFHRTWGDRAGEKPANEYWQEVIPAVKAKYPDTLFIAEVYWDLEYEMMQKGFDYCYDKRLYDRLVHENAESVRAHLTAGLDYQDRLLRFIENHDEPRAAATFYGAKERAAALVIATTPGAKLVYDGQLEGRQVQLPVFLARRRPETPNSELETFYRSLLSAVHPDLFHEGEWTLCDRSGWPDNSSFHDIVAWTWRSRDHRVLIVVNLSANRSQGMVHLPWDDLRGQTWRLVETLAWECYVRDGDDLANGGLFVDLDAWGFHFLKFE